MREQNNPNYFVQRLTAGGDIGIFNEARELTRYFNLGDLTREEEVIKAQVLSFVYETLFTPKADETLADRAEREEILEEFQKNYFHFYDDEFFNRAGLRFNNLSFREQGMFLHFVENSGEEKKERTMGATRKFGREWFHSFLALDWGCEYGERLLAIAERYPANSARVFFHEYSRVNFAAADLGREIAQVFGEEESEFIIQFQEALARRMKDIINVAYQLASQGKAAASFYGRELASEDLTQPLEALRDARINFIWIPEPADAENASLLVDNPERQAAISFRLDSEDPNEFARRVSEFFLAKAHEDIWVNDLLHFHWPEISQQDADSFAASALARHKQWQDLRRPTTILGLALNMAEVERHHLWPTDLSPVLRGLGREVKDFVAKVARFYKSLPRLQYNRAQDLKTYAASVSKAAKILGLSIRPRLVDGQWQAEWEV